MKLPSPETYEQALKYWPYKKSLAMVKDIVCKDAPKNAEVLDLMCGTGYLIGEMMKKREDLHFHGVDIDRRNVRFAKEVYSRDLSRKAYVTTFGHLSFPRQRACFKQSDVFEYYSDPLDVVLCTGALHHIPYEKQESAVRKIANLTNPKGFAIISDCYIDPFTTSQDRQLAAAKLGYEYLKATIENGAPKEVVQATLEIMANDICVREFKVPLNHRLLALKRNFRHVKTMKVWPNKQVGGFGDYIHILRK